jgi:hypothetical protein
MSGRVMTGNETVMGCGQHFSAADQNGAHRDFALFPGQPGLNKRHAHELLVYFPVHDFTTPFNLSFEEYFAFLQ